MLKKLLAIVGAAAIAPAPEAAPQPRPGPDQEPAVQDCAGEFSRLALDADGGDPAAAFCALGALAGYACQASLRARAVAAGQPEAAYLVAVNTLAGRQYFFGDPLNRLLVDEPLSLWRLAGEAARLAGCGALPELGPIFRDAAASAGTDAFGVLAPSHQPRPRHMPEHYLRRQWPAALALPRPGVVAAAPRDRRAALHRERPCRRGRLRCAGPAHGGRDSDVETRPGRASPSAGPRRYSLNSGGNPP